MSVKVFKDTYRARKYSWWGLINLAKREYKKSEFIKSKLPQLSEYFLNALGVSASDDDFPVLISRLVQDYNGNVSHHLGHYKNVPDHYKKLVNEVIDTVHQEGLYFLDLHENNILVQWVSEDECRPVFVDLVNFNRRPISLLIDKLIGKDTGYRRDRRRIGGQLSKWLK